MSAIRVDTYDRRGTVSYIDVVPVDGYARVHVRRDDETEPAITLTMSATGLDDLAQVAARAARMVRSGES